jgi:hypothetical protein
MNDTIDIPIAIGEPDFYTSKSFQGDLYNSPLHVCQEHERQSMRGINNTI